MPTPAHRASKQAARIAVLFALLTALAVTLFVVAAHTPDQAPPAAAAVVIEPTAAPVQEVCQAPSIEDVRAAVREELDRAVVEVPGRPAKWSVPSTLAGIYAKVSEQ